MGHELHRILFLKNKRLWQHILLEVVPVARSIIMKRENLTETQYLQRISSFFEARKKEERGVSFIN